MTIDLIVDTREQNPFDLEYLTALHGEDCGVVRKKLSCGDYSVEGLQQHISIERKASTGELYNNLGSKKARDRFHREMERMDLIDRAFIICEFPSTHLHTFPENSEIPTSKRQYLRMSAKFFRKLVYEVSEKFDVEYIFCNDRAEAEKKTFELLLKAGEDYGLRMARMDW